MDKQTIKRVTRLSWVREQAKEEFEMLKKEPEPDPTSFTEEGLEHYVNFLLRVPTDSVAGYR